MFNISDSDLASAAAALRTGQFDFSPVFGDVDQLRATLAKSNPADSQSENMARSLIAADFYQLWISLLKEGHTENLPAAEARLSAAFNILGPLTVHTLAQARSALLKIYDSGVMPRSGRWNIDQAWARVDADLSQLQIKKMSQVLVDSLRDMFPERSRRLSTRTRLRGEVLQLGPKRATDLLKLVNVRMGLSLRLVDLGDWSKMTVTDLARIMAQSPAKSRTPQRTPPSAAASRQNVKLDVNYGSADAAAHLAARAGVAQTRLSSNSLQNPARRFGAANALQTSPHVTLAPLAVRHQNTLPGSRFIGARHALWGGGSVMLGVKNPFIQTSTFRLH